MKLLDIINKFIEWRLRKKTSDFTFRGYNCQLRLFCLFMRNCKIEKITYDEMIEWLRLNEEVGYSPKASNYKAEILKQFIIYCRKMGYQVFDPDLIPVPEAKQKLPRVVTKEEYDKLVEASFKLEKESHNKYDLWAIWRNRAILGLLYDTGARVGEIMSVAIDILDLDQRKVLIRTEKARYARYGRPFREIFWSEKTNKYIKKWLEIRKRYFNGQNSYLFILIRNRKSFGGQIHHNTVQHFLRIWSKLAGVKTLNAHSFRHRKGHEIIKQGGSMADVMSILGHSSIDSSKIYVEMFDSELKERARKFIK